MALTAAQKAALADSIRKSGGLGGLATSSGTTTGTTSGTTTNANSGLSRNTNSNTIAHQAAAIRAAAGQSTPNSSTTASGANTTTSAGATNNTGLSAGTTNNTGLSVGVDQKLLNDILYNKNKYDEGKATGNGGLSAWAANSATQYYNQLSPEDAAYVRSLNAQQLTDEIARLKGASASSATTDTGGTTGTTLSNGSPYDIAGEYDANYAAGAARIRAARDEALAALAGQDTMVKNQAQANLNQNDVTAARQAQILREQMAQAGILPSGDYVSQQVAQNTATGQNANSIRQDMATRLEQLLAQENQIKNAANLQDIELLNEIKAAQAAATRDQYNLDRNYGLDYANTYGQGQNGGPKTIQQQQLNWNMNPNNPINQGQVLANESQKIKNQISQLDLKNYPEQIKLEMEKLKQQVATGAFDPKTAEYKYKELTDPNSTTNQANRIALELSKIDLENYPTESRLRIEQLQKTIDQIGAAPYRTPEEIERDKLEIKRINEEIKQLQEGEPEEVQTAESMRTYFDSMAKYDNYGKLTNGDALATAITESDLNDYEMYQTMLRYGLWRSEWPIPTKPTGN